MRIFVFSSGTIALATLSVASCNQSLSNDDVLGTTTGLSAAELLECQESGGTCPSPEDPGSLCCPIAESAGCDCFTTGGLQGEGGTCRSICDGGAAERLQDDSGCWSWVVPGNSCMMFDTRESEDVGTTDTAPLLDVSGPFDAERPLDASPDIDSDSSGSG